MKEGLLEKVTALGHWRVNFRPTIEPQEQLSLHRCNEIIERSSVSIRGWDFPHVSHRHDDEGGSANMGQYVENWTDWNGFFEFWRMYRSTQFIFYGALHEDTDVWRENQPPGAVINVVGAIYTITEFIEFSRRLVAAGLYRRGLFIDVSLRNTANRRLVAGRGRVPFFDTKRNGAPEIRIKRRYSQAEVQDNSREIAISYIADFFDHFGWSPDDTQIRSEQEKFFRKEFGW